MSGTGDTVKGRIKEATGVLTDDDRLRNNGKLDQAAGKVKDAARTRVNMSQDILIRDIFKRNG